MADVVISISGLGETRERLLKLGRSVSDLRPVMGDIGQYLAKFFSSEVFASRGGVIGEPWAPLSARYAAYKARRYAGRQPLVRTGTMQRSFKYTHGAQFARVTNGASYFDYHQLGTRRMPQRMMMKVDDTREREITRMIEQYVKTEGGAND